jgi:hypothetical protein
MATTIEADQYVKRSEFDALVKEALANLLGISTTAPSYLSTKEAAKELEYSKDQLLNKVRTGFYRLGKEVQDRRSQNSSRPIYYFNIEKCRNRDATLPEKRKY